MSAYPQVGRSEAISSEIVRSQPYYLIVVITSTVLLLAAAGAHFVANGSIPMGVAVVVAAGFLFLVFADIAIAIAVWVAVLYIEGLHVLSVGPTLVEILIVLAWLGAGGIRRGRLPTLRDHRPLLLAMVLLGCWLTFSIAWAEAPGRAALEARSWWVAILVYVVIATSFVTPRNVVYAAAAFVVGAVTAVTIGFLGLGTIANAADVDAGRLQAAGDPNYQAAAFLAAMFMAGGLLSVFRGIIARVVLVVALGVITIGFFATESRGGFLALGFALVASFVLLPRQRRQIVALALAGAGTIAVWLNSRPDAFDRLTSFGGGGSGRDDVWTVAWRVFEHHPWLGVGLGNFQVVEARYVLLPGNLTHVRLISETPKLTHNAYLGLLTETGVVGLVLYGIVVVLSLRTSWLAARQFDMVGAVGLGNLARSVLIATIGMLAAMFFISNPYDPRLWVLLALGPVLHTLAGRADPLALAKRR